MKKKEGIKQIGSNIKGGVSSVLSGTFLAKENFPKLFGFLVYVAVLLCFLVFNTYQAEQCTRDIAKNTKTLNDLRVKDIQLKSDIMQNSKQSVLAKRLAPYGIKETTDPLKRITAEKQ